MASLTPIQSKFLEQPTPILEDPAIALHRFVCQIIIAATPYNAAAIEKLIQENKDNYANYEHKKKYLLKSMSFVLIVALKAHASIDHIKFLIENVTDKISFIEAKEYPEDSPHTIAFNQNRIDVLKLFNVTEPICTKEEAVKEKVVKKVVHLVLNKYNLPNFRTEKIQLFSSIKSLTISADKSFHFDFDDLIIKVVKSCHQLIAVNINGFKIKSDTLSHLLKDCVHLKSLSFPVKKNVEHIEILRTFDLRHLESLGLKRVHKTGIKELLLLLKNLSHLLKLNLRFSQISDSKLKKITKLCPHLEFLDLTGCKKITLQGKLKIPDTIKIVRLDK